MSLIVTQEQREIISKYIGNNIVITFEVFTEIDVNVTIELQLDLFLGFNYIWEIIKECINFAVYAEILKVEVEYLN